jgi:hypothetical protein
MKSPWESVTQTCTRLGIKPADRLLAVHIATQTMQLFHKGRLVRSYVVSTSKRPPSNVKDSLGTPRGLHAIAEKIGADQPPGMVFKGRVPTGRHFNDLPDADTHPNLITSRILWLRGLEPGVNQSVNATGESVDTHARYVYIHGTNHEDLLGTPQSAGCVLMANLDIIALYEEVRTGDLVWIE